MKLSYFPYLPNSKNEDNKRYKYVCDKIEKDPFAYHRKKNASFLFNKYYVASPNEINFDGNQNKIKSRITFISK